MPRATDKQGPGTVYTFAVGGKAELPQFAQYRMESLLSGVPYDPADAQAGRALYVSYCVACHGVPGVDRGGAISNLGYVPQAIITNLERMIFKGPFTPQGMPDFTGKLKPEDVPKLQAFIQGTADAVRARAAAPAPAPRRPQPAPAAPAAASK